MIETLSIEVNLIERSRQKIAQTETYICNLSFFKTLGSEIKVIG